MKPVSADDLIRVAELIRLAAQTAKALTHSATNGKFSNIMDIVHRIEAAAQELADAAQQIDGDEPPGSSGTPLLCL